MLLRRIIVKFETAQNPHDLDAESDPEGIAPLPGSKFDRKIQMRGRNEGTRYHSPRRAPK
jgi:hypothetical protein